MQVYQGFSSPLYKIDRLARRNLSQTDQSEKITPFWYTFQFSFQGPESASLRASEHPEMAMLCPSQLFFVMRSRSHTKLTNPFGLSNEMRNLHTKE